MKQGEAILCLILSSILLSCHDASRHEATLQWADSLNRNYIPITSDSQLVEAAEFYDRHGTSNERMRAHYLLGCAYRDMGEAPKALDCFYSAIDNADTLDKDCDFEVLMRLHSQAGNICIRQYATPDVALVEFKKACHYAMLRRDTLNYMSLVVQQVNAYYEKHAYDSVLVLTDQLISLKDDTGAVGKFISGTGMLVTPVRSCLENSDIEQARSYLSFIDFKELENQHLNKTIGILNGFKGDIFLRENKIDSSECYFRKSLQENQSVTNKQFVYHGMMNLYKLKGSRDSIIAYANLYAQYNDSSILQLSTEDTQRAYHLYNYTRNEHIAKVNYAKSQRLTIAIACLLGVIVVIFLIAYFVLQGIRSRVREKMISINQQYSQYLGEYRWLNNEIRLLRSSEGTKDTLLAEREKEIKQLKEILDSYQSTGINPEQWNEEANIQNSEIIIHMHKLAAGGKQAGSQELTSVRQLCNTVYPDFIGKLSSLCPQLNLKQTTLCVLIRLRFIPSEIASLMGSSEQTLSNMRARLHEKLFRIQGTAKNFNERIMEL